MNEDSQPTKLMLQLNGAESEKNAILCARIVLVAAVTCLVLGVLGVLVIPFDTVIENVGRRGMSMGTYAFALFPIAALSMYWQFKRGIAEVKKKDDRLKTSVAAFRVNAIVAGLAGAFFVTGQIVGLYIFADAAGML
ncbi:hypothetical protein NMP99_01280 [Glutamicibacter mishrai]|uniref:hypothetical protein n=1 Tax=Glutamicibacter mishrai TaxID=1775880 RepID=UPI0020CCE56C|nr:hypothetical protein [Glutamicibacter mishrai]UTT39971.1 hypothetical protein NMP99_01280 [Glutamicibacter mishrai]